MELDEIGVLLDESWRIKKSLTDKISNRKVDNSTIFLNPKELLVVNFLVLVGGVLCNFL